MIEMKEKISELVSTVLGLKQEELFNFLETPQVKTNGDLSLPCFKLSKTLKQNPNIIAQNIGNALIMQPLHEAGVHSVSVVGGYVNFFYKRDDIAKNILTQPVNKQIEQIKQKERVIIEYSSPNIAKHFKLYHIRSTMIGQSLANIHESLGYDVVKINYLGDWGTQFGNLMAAYTLWGNEQTVKKDPINELSKLYVTFHQQSQKNLSLKKKGQEWFQKLENNDPEALRLWKWFKEESWSVFEKLYNELNVSFDHVTGESVYSKKGEEVVEELKKKQLALLSQGAWIVSMTHQGIAPCIVKKQNGTTTYATRDLAAAIERQQQFQPSKMLYVVDQRQSLHFQQLFDVLKQLNNPIAHVAKHIPFGIMKVNGETGSTRQGKGLLLEDVLQDAFDEAKKMITTNKNSQVKQANIDEVAKQLSHAAIVFHDLKQHPSHEINFVQEEALSFEGKTGPYLQYTNARIQSLLKKQANTKKMDINDLDVSNDLVWNIIMHLERYTKTLKEAAKKEDPSQIARYLLELAQLFNHFYAKERVITENEQETAGKLLLCKKVSEFLQHGLALLCIESPEQL